MNPEKTGSMRLNTSPKLILRLTPMRKLSGSPAMQGKGICLVILSVESDILLPRDRGQRIFHYEFGYCTFGLEQE